MRSYRNWFIPAVIGVGALVTQPVIGQQQPAAPARGAAPQRPAAPPATQKPVPAIGGAAKPGDVAQKQSNNPPEWWYLGKQEEGDLLFMDAANLVEYESGDVITFRGMFYYGDPRITTNYSTGAKQIIAYETYEAWMSCSERELSDEKHSFYAPDGKEIVIEETEDTMKLVPTKASPAEYAFVCAKERAGGTHKFEKIATDPVTYSRKK